MRRGGSGDNSKAADLRQRGDDFILNALSEKSVLFVRAKIFERQHRDRFVQRRGVWGLLRQRGGGGSSGRGKLKRKQRSRQHGGGDNDRSPFAPGLGRLRFSRR